MFYDDSILSGTKTCICGNLRHPSFYDDSILSGTKTTVRCVYFNRGFMMTQFFQVLKPSSALNGAKPKFYDDSILSGTKTLTNMTIAIITFYDDSILSGTKTCVRIAANANMFYDDSILSGTKTSNTTFYIKVKHMYLSFA